jgi:hypothetical protein
MLATDDRIKQMIAKKKAAEEATARADAASADAGKAKQEKLKQLNDKWVKDTHVIDAAIKSLNEKLVPLGVTFTFLAKPGNPGTSIATAEFGGRGPKGMGKMAFNVFETGEVRVYFDGRNANSNFDLTIAEQKTYADVLLNFADHLI